MLHHTFCDSAAGEPIWAGAAQNPEHVELRLRQPRGLEGLGDPAGRNLGRALDLEVGLFLQRGERLGLLELGLESSSH